MLRQNGSPTRRRHTRAMDHTNAVARHANQISTVPPFGTQEPHRSWSVERLLPGQYFVPAWESSEELCSLPKKRNRR